MNQSRTQGRTLRCFLTIAIAIAISVLTLSSAVLAESVDNEHFRHPSVEKQSNDKSAQPTEDHKEKADRKQSHIRKHSMYVITEAAGIIGVEPDLLKKELKAGKSIAEVAKTKGIEEADLMDRLIAIKLKKIDEAVKSGKWTSEKAEKMKEKLPDHIHQLLNHKGFHKSRESSE